MFVYLRKYFIRKHASATLRHHTLVLHRNKLDLVKIHASKYYVLLCFFLDDRSCVYIAGVVYRFENQLCCVCLKFFNVKVLFREKMFDVQARQPNGVSEDFVMIFFLKSV
jgi:hypothetical protein